MGPPKLAHSTATAFTDFKMHWNIKNRRLHIATDKVIRPFAEATSRKSFISRLTPSLADFIRGQTGNP